MAYFINHRLDTVLNIAGLPTIAIGVTGTNVFSLLFTAAKQSLGHPFVPGAVIEIHPDITVGQRVNIGRSIKMPAIP